MAKDTAKKIFAVFLVLFFLIIISLVFFYKPKEEKESAASFYAFTQYLMEDARAKFPDADLIEIVSIMPLEDYSLCNGSCMSPGQNLSLITLKLVYLGEATCPQRYHLKYVYPQREFANLPPEHVVKDCDFCKNSNCFITMQEEAVIASLNFKESSQLRSFVEQYNAKPYILNKDGSDIWNVEWHGKNQTFSIVFTSKGEVIKVGRK